jgi:hypothetical protein
MIAMMGVIHTTKKRSAKTAKKISNALLNIGGV